MGLRVVSRPYAPIYVRPSLRFRTLSSLNSTEHNTTTWTFWLLNETSSNSLNSCTPKVCPSQDSDFLISVISLLGRWVEFEVLISTWLLTFLEFSCRCRGRGRHQQEAFMWETQGLGFLWGCWSQTMFAMSLKLWLFSLYDSNASP